MPRRKVPRRNSAAPLVLAVLGLLLAPPGARAADPVATSVRLVHLYPLEGLPSDSLLRAAFTAGFDSVFAESSIALERPDGVGGWRDGGSRPNLFAGSDYPKLDSLWSLQVVVGAPPPFVSMRRSGHSHTSERHVDIQHRASRGMTLAVLVLSPEAFRAGARASPEHYAFSFPPELAPATVFEAIPTAFLFPWRMAGAASASLALELLHHRSGDLPATSRCSIVPAQRAATVR